jgi:plastocyanin
MRLVVRFAFLFLVVAAFAWCGKNSSAPTQPTVNVTPTRPAGGGATPTPPPGMGATPTAPPAAAHMVSVGLGGNQFVDGQTGSNVTTISAGQTVMWSWAGGPHSTTSGNCCTPDGKWDSGVRSSGSFSQAFPSAGSFPYFCTVHGSMMTGMVMVNP